MYTQFWNISIVNIQFFTKIERLQFQSETNLRWFLHFLDLYRKGFTQMQLLPFHNFLSFPNYQSTLRLNKVVSRGHYTSLEDVIRNLYNLNFQDQHIRQVHSAFHESVCLMHTLQTVRAVIIQIEPAVCGFDKIHVLDNTSVPLSERVLYIRMHDYVGGKLRERCFCFQPAVLFSLLVVFVIIGIIISLRSMVEMII